MHSPYSLPTSREHSHCRKENLAEVLLSHTDNIWGAIKQENVEENHTMLGLGAIKTMHAVYAALNNINKYRHVSFHPADHGGHQPGAEGAARQRRAVRKGPAAILHQGPGEQLAPEVQPHGGRL